MSSNVRALSVFVFAILLGAVLVVGADAQPLPAMVYGGPANERATALVEGADPGFCLGGWTRSFGPVGSSNILVVKTDPLGLPIWSRVSLGEDGDDEAYSMVRTHDLCYTLTGWTTSFGGPARDVFVLKLDVAGANLWGRVYCGTMNDEAYSIVETMDAGYAVVGLTYSFGPAPHPNILLLRLNPVGGLMWARVYWCFPHFGEDEGFSIVQTPDSGYAIVGRAKTMNPVHFDPFVLKVDKAGQVQWARTIIGEGDEDEGYSVALDLPGNILAAGWTREYGTGPYNTADMFVAQFTTAGAPIWSRTYGWPDGDEEVLDDRSLVATMDGGSAVCGPTTSVGPGIPNPNFLILKLDPAGLPMWVRSHPSPYDPGLLSDVPLPMIEPMSGGYAIAGWTNSFPHVGGGDDFHLLTLDALGNRPICVEPQDPLIDTLPWIELFVEDSLIMLEPDSIWLDPVDVLFFPICEETTAVREGRSAPGAPDQAVGLRVLGGAVELTLARDAVITVGFYAADGRRLAVLANRWLTAGRHVFDLPESGPGVHLVRASGTATTCCAKVVRF